MADVQLNHLGNSGQNGSRLIIQPMASMNLQAQIAGLAGGIPQGIKGRPRLSGTPFAQKIAKGPGVQFNDLGPNRCCRFDLIGIGSDEEGHPAAGLPEPPHSWKNQVHLTGHVQTALGRPLLAPFRHQANGMWAVLEGNADHLIGHGHLKIEGSPRRLEQVRQPGNIEI